VSTQRSTAAFAAAIFLVGLLGACSDDSEDGPPATDPSETVVEHATESTLSVSTTDTVPTAGIGAINGPATFDSAFSGANPGGDEGGG
jgi:hypothetical protein